MCAVVNCLLLLHFSSPSRNVSHLFSIPLLECFIIFTTTISKLFSGSLPTFSLIMIWVFTTFLYLQYSSLTSHFPTYCVNAHFFPDCCIISIAPHLHSKLLKLVEWLVWALQMDWLTTRFLSLQLSLPSLMVVLYLSVPFVGVYGISLTLGSLFAEDWLHFFCLACCVVWGISPGLCRHLCAVHLRLRKRSSRRL